MRHTLSIAATVLLVLAALSSWQPAFSQEKPAQGPGLAAMYCHIPNLTDEQKQKIEQLHRAFLKEMAPLRNQLRSERFALMSLKTANNPDQKAINAKIDAIAKLRADIEKKQVAHRLQIRSLLTDEQKAVFDARPGRTAGWMKGRPGLGKGRPGPMGHPGMKPEECPMHGPEN
ncbi:MAG: Spy/CpxP family protein refolding chaperone [bacterium]|jgi:Spy/CpxP family protein refolding chaperone|nr:Spy/CpxP family protein refolding chaperone [candidate division KSB1 bacterium]MDH7558816.1 Spy/CpxP family protein refolding chaperone [bacterium]